ncbi:hypothetical protein ACFL6E_05425 [Candidatus Neomarinimicrobiota bacterium]
MTKVRNIILPTLILVGLLGLHSIAFAQHRGDQFGFQGLSSPQTNGVKALGMGGAYTSIGGDISSLFYNSAGLASIEGFSISIAGDSYNKMWRENQVYRANRQFVSLSFILDGILIPDPANNGLYDHDVFQNDSTYVVNDPLLGEDNYSEKLADWERTTKASELNSIAVGMPLNLMGKKLYLAGAYNKRYQILDYDRNHTYITPHLGYFYYDGFIDRIEDPIDSTRVYWSDYERERTGNLSDITGAISMELNESISLGAGFALTTGETVDGGFLNRVGYFDLDAANSMMFSYDTLNTSTMGTSKFSAMSFNVSAMIELDAISIGVRVNPGYTLKREWETTFVSDTAETSTFNGTDVMEIPMGFAVGISVQPKEYFRFSADLVKANYSGNKFTLAVEDSLFRSWPDQLIVGLGVEYKPVQWLSLLGGYRAQPETFIPDGAAIEERGPIAESWTAGASIKLFFGYLDVAYEARTLKYYDAYFSNTNFAMETLNNVSVGYRIAF